MSSDIAQRIGGSDVVLDSKKWQSPDGDADYPAIKLPIAQMETIKPMSIITIDLPRGGLS